MVARSHARGPEAVLDVDWRPTPDGADPLLNKPSSAKTTPIPVPIERLHSAVAGRARLRVGGMQGSPELAQLLERGLTGFGGVRDVSASVLTGNVLVHYDDRSSLDEIIDRMGALLRGEAVPAEDLAKEHPHWHSLTASEIATALGTTEATGLSHREAAERLAKEGANAIPPLRQRSDLSILLGQFQSLPVALLAGAAALSLATGGLVEAGAILAVVALNGVIGFTTESRAEQTIRTLGPPGPPTARVVRDGLERGVPAESLVPGDVIVLQRGMVVPADGRLARTTALTVSEAMLTGESLPITKSVEALSSTSLALGDRSNMVYRGTIVTGGSGRAMVVATGPRTEIGRIQRLVGATIAPNTPMQRQLDEMGEQLVWITLAASGLIFCTGWLHGLAAFQLVRSALSVAVAAVPEGLPMVATTTLALGVEELRSHGIFVRRLQAVETLAAVNVVCFDKTGTLTMGSMSVEAIAAGDRVWPWRLAARADQASAHPPDDDRLLRLLQVVSLCSECEINNHDGRNLLAGSATERALVQAALNHGIDVPELRRKFVRRATQYRTEAYRFMATTHDTGNGILLAIKGSPREVLARCRWEALPDGRREILTGNRRAEIEALNADMARQALRVLGVASHDMQGATFGDHAAEIDIEGLTWLGLVGLADPVRAEIPELMRELHRAGIQTIMLTGDQSPTARAVAREIGLGAGGAPEIVDSAWLDDLTPIELAMTARRAHAFARVSPGQKLRIVRTLQDSGAVVAMIGDGINDSPALRAANVGIAVGRDGPAAARDVADVFIASDDLRALLTAIQRGRATYTNVRRAIHYLLSTNTSEILLMLGGTTVGLGGVLSPMQLLWINLVSDVLPGIGLALEPPDRDVMEQLPRPADEAIVQREHIGRLAGEAGVLTASAVGAALFGAMRHGASSPQTGTLAFGSLTIAQLLHALTYRSTAQGMLAPGRLFSNPALPVIVGGSLAVQGAAMLVPGIRNLLGVAPMGVVDVLAMLAGGTLPLVLGEAARSRAMARRGERLHFRRARPPEEPANG